MYSDIVNDSLSEFSYDADLAGLSYNFLQHSGGLLVSMSGYNDKMVVLVQHVLEKIKALAVNPERLAVMKEQVSASPTVPKFSIKFALFYLRPNVIGRTFI